MLIHFESEDVVSHRVIDVVNFVDTDFLGFDDVFPKSFVEGYLTFHVLCLNTIFNHDRLRTFLVISRVNGLGNLGVLELEFFHVGLDSSYFKNLFFLISIVQNL